MSILLNRTLRLFLDSIGRRDEYEFYLEKFRTDQAAAFALICPERAGMEETAPLLAFDLDFLLQLGLFSVILLAGPDSAAMRALLFRDRHPFEEIRLDGNELADVLRDSVQPLLGRLAAARAAGKAAVIVAEGAGMEEVLPLLVPEVARRVHFIRPNGPLRNAAGEPLLYYTLNRPPPGGLEPDDEPLIQRAAILLEQRPGLHISVASPWNLLKELFTVKGAGCVIRRGAVIRRAHHLAAAEEDHLAALLEESFGKHLRDRAALRETDEFVLEENYRGVAMLQKHKDGMYLSKFAVGTAARGEGLAQDLWREVTAAHERLFWRARADNPINHWYEKQADGYHREDKWKVFWRGIRWQELDDIIGFCLSRREDFE